ncbi:unnamed protein product, partial [Prorocentrum cordatum]
TKATVGRAHFANPVAEWWAFVSAATGRARALAKNGTDSTQAKRSRDTAVAKAEEHGLNTDAGLARATDDFGRRRVPEEVAHRRQLPRRIHDLSSEDFEQFNVATARWAAPAASRAQARAGRQRAKRVSTTWKTAHGLVHKQVKGDKPATLEAALPGETVADPLQMELREEEELEGHAAQSARQASLAVPARYEMGVDALRRSIVSRPPGVAVQEWVDMMIQVEQDLARPRQVHAALLALLPKSRGWDRAIGVLSLLIKCRSKARASATGAWPDGLEQHWGVSLEDSSALRAALCWPILDESAVAMGFCAVEARANLAPWRLRRRAWTSGAIGAERPIVAGSNRGVKVAERFLHPFLQAASAGAPAVGLGAFVDGAIFRAEGKKQAAIDSMGDAMKISAKQREAPKLTPSPKSVVVSLARRGRQHKSPDVTVHQRQRTATPLISERALRRARGAPGPEPSSEAEQGQ